MVMLAQKGPDDDIELFSIIARDISEQKRLETTLVRQATHDPLTDLNNRRRLEEELNLALAESRRYGVHGALMLLDLDEFTQINHIICHLRWNQLLVRVANLHR